VQSLVQQLAVTQRSVAAKEWPPIRLLHLARGAGCEGVERKRGRERERVGATILLGRG